MYKEIHFPEGINTIFRQYNPYDAFDDNYPIDIVSGEFLFDNIGPILAPKNFSKTKCYKNIAYKAREYTYIPTFNVSSFDYSQINDKGNLFPGSAFFSNQFIVFEGNPPVEIGNVNTEKAKIYYEYQYEESYKNNMIKQIPHCTWIPYGDVPVQVRVLKDGAWMAGETLTLANTQMNYLGGGLYEGIIHQEPRERYNYLITDGTYKDSVNMTLTSPVFFWGDNSGNVLTYSGETLSELITDNTNGWYYDAELGGYRNNVISDKQTTTMTITVPTTDIEVIYGMSSEEGYDFGSILDSSGKALYSSKGKEGDNIKINLTSPDGIFVFKYEKDTSGSKDKDAFWVKSITYTQLPPYPEN